jgi:tRNA-dihydrouridine synthase A
MINNTPLISVAPMMDYTDTHFRYLLRLIAPDIQLYTEMITAQAILHGDKTRLLAFHPAEKYVALQLGGSDPASLAQCARIGEAFGYDEINLNVGCPSSRVSSGRFGACLMLEPQRVADCVAAMQAAVHIPVTVKCRIGVDEQDSDAALHHFITLIAKAGCSKIIIHARKAWLKGLSPKENREIPPLHYPSVHQIKKDFSHLKIIINGGMTHLREIEAQLPHVDGVMIGRAVCSNPYLLAEIEAAYFPSRSLLSRVEVIQQFIPYVQEQLKKKVRLNSMTRHLLGLFMHQRGASAWRRYLSQHTYQSGAGVEVIDQALQLLAHDV